MIYKIKKFIAHIPIIGKFLLWCSSLILLRKRMEEINSVQMQFNIKQQDIIEELNNKQSQMDRIEEELKNKQLQITEELKSTKEEIKSTKEELNLKIVNINESLINLQQRVKDREIDLGNATEILLHLVDREKEFEKLYNITEDLYKNIEELRLSSDYFERNTLPNYRRNILFKSSKIMQHLKNDELFEYEKLIGSTNDSAAIKTYFNTISNAYKNMVLDEMNYHNNIIVILTFNYNSQVGQEAIANEVRNLYNILSCSSKYNYKIVSIEENNKTYYNMENEIIYIGEPDIVDCLSNINPILIIACFSNISLGELFFHPKLNRIPILYRSTAQNPIQFCDERVLENLLHINEMKKQRYLVVSEYALNVLQNNGFRNTKILYPVMNLDSQMVSNKKANLNGNMIIGFASSPMVKEQEESRGIYLLGDVIKHQKDVNFIILWRNVNLEVPSCIKNLSNCEIRFGKCDMNEFYKEINCLIIPYTNYDDNHGCSMSAIEAVMSGIPVISTKSSGFSEIIEKTGVGEVVEENYQSIEMAINNIKHNYSSYNTNDNVKKVVEIFASNIIVNLIEETIEQYSYGYVPTIDEWDNQLRLFGKRLIKGHNAIKEYYQEQEITSKYTEDRFITYPLNCLNIYEKASIQIIFENSFGEQQIKILDIASGNGRILEEDIKYGKCFALDSSNEMLNIIKEKFSDTTDLSIYKCDYYSDDINEKFDVITTFRYLRHFDGKSRRFLYKKIYNSLNDNGMLIFDVPNIQFETYCRNKLGWEKYNIYDVFHSLDDIIEEMFTNGFEVKYAIPVGQGLEIVEGLKTEPVSWTIGAIKR